MALASNDREDNPDKNYLYGEFQRGQRWRDKLSKKLAHKSLDISENDDMNVDNSRSMVGMGWKELAVIAIAGFGGALVYNQFNQQPAPQPATPPAAISPADSEYEVRFFDAQGNPIQLQQFPLTK